MNRNRISNYFPAILTSTFVPFYRKGSLSLPRTTSISIITAEIMPMIFAFIPFIPAGRITKFSSLLIYNPVRNFKFSSTLLASKLCVWLKSLSEIVTFLKCVSRSFTLPIFISKSGFIRTDDTAIFRIRLCCLKFFVADFAHVFIFSHAKIIPYCMGSGTTGVACKNTGRNFIGIEKDADYFAIAEKRINET